VVHKQVTQKTTTNWQVIYGYFIQTIVLRTQKLALEGAEEKLGNSVPYLKSYFLSTTRRPNKPFQPFPRRAATTTASRGGDMPAFPEKKSASRFSSLFSPI
jgi:hypothetical protein